MVFISILALVILEIDVSTDLLDKIQRNIDTVQVNICITSLKNEIFKYPCRSAMAATYCTLVHEETDLSSSPVTI